jgi:hypothetical protein
MIGRIVRYGCGACLLLVIIAAGVLWYVCYHTPRTEQVYEARIDAELPRGTPRNAVEAWLHAEGFSAYANGRRLESSRPVDGHACTETNGRLTVTFDFDAQDRLIGRTVSKFDYSF